MKTFILNAELSLLLFSTRTKLYGKTRELHLRGRNALAHILVRVAKAASLWPPTLPPQLLPPRAYNRSQHDARLTWRGQSRRRWRWRRQRRRRRRRRRWRQRLTCSACGRPTTTTMATAMATTPTTRLLAHSLMKSRGDGGVTFFCGINAEKRGGGGGAKGAR